MLANITTPTATPVAFDGHTLLVFVVLFAAVGIAAWLDGARLLLVNVAAPRGTGARVLCTLCRHQQHPERPHNLPATSSASLMRCGCACAEDGRADFLRGTR